MKYFTNYDYTLGYKARVKSNISHDAKFLRKICSNQIQQNMELMIYLNQELIIPVMLGQFNI